MAIGKVNAYATVQAPNVDFGAIALNAQKFQQADLERQKEAKVAQLKAEKEKPFEFKPQVFKNDSGLDFYNISKQEDANKVVGDYYELSKLNEVGKLNATGAAKLQALKQNFENGDNALKTVGEKYTEYVKGIKDHSGAYKETEDYLKGFTADNGKNVIRSTDSNGNPYFQQAEIDPKTNAAVIGEDGKPKVRKFIDKNGVERDGWGHADILSGRAFEPLNSFDDKGFSTDVAKLVGPEKIGIDNGVTKVVREKLNSANIATINTLIDTQVLNNPDHLKDVLYKLDPVKYKNPKSEYTKEDREFAKKGMEKSIYGGIGLSNVTDVSIESGIAAEKNRKEKSVVVPTSFELGDRTANYDAEFVKERNKAIDSNKSNFTYNGVSYNTNENKDATGIGYVRTKLSKTTAKQSLSYGDGIPYKTSKSGFGLITNTYYDPSDKSVSYKMSVLTKKGISYALDKAKQNGLIDFAANFDDLSDEDKMKVSKYATSDMYDVRHFKAVTDRAKGILSRAEGVRDWRGYTQKLIDINKPEIDEYNRNKSKKPKTGILD